MTRIECQRASTARSVNVIIRNDIIYAACSHPINKDVYDICDMEIDKQHLFEFSTTSASSEIPEHMKANEKCVEQKSRKKHTQIVAKGNGEQQQTSKLAVEIDCFRLRHKIYTAVHSSTFAVYVFNICSFFIHRAPCFSCVIFYIFCQLACTFISTSHRIRALGLHTQLVWRMSTEDMPRQAP